MGRRTRWLASGGLALALVTLGAGCAQQERDPPSQPSPTVGSRTGFGDDVPVDLAISFVEGTEEAQMTAFMSEVLSRLPADGRPGDDHLEGVQYTGGDYWRGMVYVTFFPTVSKDQRRAVLEVVEASPLVEKVLQDVVPADLPPGT